MPMGMRRGPAVAVIVAIALGAAPAQADLDTDSVTDADSVTDRDPAADTGSVTAADTDTDTESVTDTDSDTGSVTDSDTESVTAADTAADTDSDTESVTASDAAPAPVDPLAHREREIEEAMRRVSLQQRDHSTLLPWLLIGSGIAAVAVSGGYGVGHVLLCERSCGIEFWPPWVLMGGLAMITGGTVWLQSARADREAIDSRRYHLEQQLQRLRWEQGRAERSPRGAIAGLRF